MRDVKVKCGTFTPNLCVKLGRSDGAQKLQSGMHTARPPGLFCLQGSRKEGEDKGGLNAQNKSRK